MNEIVQQVLTSAGEVLTNLANVLGTTATHIYRVMVVQQVLEGTMAVVGVLGLAFGSYWLASTFDRGMKKKFGEDYMLEDQLLVWAFGLFLSFSILSRLIPVVTGSVPRIANPEYYVLDRIWSEVRRK